MLILFLGSRPPPSVSSISSLSPSTAASDYVGNRTPSNYSAVLPPSPYGVASPPSTYSTTPPPSAPPSTRSAGPPPVRPPGLSGPPSSFGRSTPQFRPYQHFDWSDEVERGFEAGQEDAQSTAGASTVSRGRGGYTAPPPRVPNSDGAIEPDQDYDYEDEDLPRRSTADAMKALYDGAPSASVGNNAGLHDVEEDVDYLAWTYPEALSATTRDWSDELGGDPDKPWEDYDAPRMEPPTKVNIKGGELWICPLHGPLCNPGICKARRQLEKQRQDAQEIEDRQKAKEKRLKNQEKKKLKAERQGLSHEPPPHWYKGAGGDSSSSRGSGSGSDSDSEDGSEEGTCVTFN